MSDVTARGSAGIQSRSTRRDRGGSRRPDRIRRLTTALMAAAASLALSLGGWTVATASAAVLVSITPNFPVAVSVFDQAVATSLRLQNNSNGAHVADSLRVDSIFF